MRGIPKKDRQAFGLLIAHLQLYDFSIALAVIEHANSFFFRISAKFPLMTSSNLAIVFQNNFFGCPTQNDTPYNLKRCSFLESLLKNGRQMIDNIAAEEQLTQIEEDAAQLAIDAIAAAEKEMAAEELAAHETTTVDGSLLVTFKDDVVVVETPLIKKSWITKIRQGSRRVKRAVQSFFDSISTRKNDATATSDVHSSTSIVSVAAAADAELITPLESIIESQSAQLVAQADTLAFQKEMIAQLQSENRTQQSEKDFLVKYCNDGIDQSQKLIDEIGAESDEWYFKFAHEYKC